MAVSTPPFGCVHTRNCWLLTRRGKRQSALQCAAPDKVMGSPCGHGPTVRKAWERCLPPAGARAQKFPIPRTPQYTRRAQSQRLTPAQAPERSHFAHGRGSPCLLCHPSQSLPHARGGIHQDLGEGQSAIDLRAQDPSTRCAVDSWDGQRVKTVCSAHDSTTKSRPKSSGALGP